VEGKKKGWETGREKGKGKRGGTKGGQEKVKGDGEKASSAGPFFRCFRRLWLLH